MWQKHVSFRPLRWSNFQFIIPGHQIFKNSDHKNPIGHIRWPIIFFSLCMICTAEKLSICLYFSILRILSFQCPGMTHITNLTRMPQVPKGPFGPLGQPACFGAGCYIEMALSYHQPHQHELVGGWKLIFGEKRAVAGRFFINPDDSKG